MSGMVMKTSSEVRTYAALLAADKEICLQLSSKIVAASEWWLRPRTMRANNSKDVVLNGQTYSFALTATEVDIA